MRITGVISLVALVAATALSNFASAASLATAATALNIRSGPGPQYDVIGVIKARARAQMLGCIQDSLWCQVHYHGKRGWAYSKYLTTRVAARPQVIAGNVTQANVPVITYRKPLETTVGSAVRPPTVTGALIDDPEGTTTHYVVNPPATVRTYVIEHPVQQSYLNGEVVVGAGLPQEVTLQPVPDYGYDYAYVNRVPVLVQPHTRRIVYIYR